MDDHASVVKELLKDFKKGQLVKLNPHGLFDEPYLKDQFAVVISVQENRGNHYRNRIGVWVWLQKDEIKALIDPWDLITPDETLT